MVLSLLRTRSGDLWVGTAAGLLACPGACERWNNPSNVQTLRRSAIYALHEASDGTIWIGSEAGLYSYDPRRSLLTAQNATLKLPRRSAVLYIAQDTGGVLWFASELGIADAESQDRRSGRWVIRRCGVAACGGSSPMPTATCI